MNFKDSYTPFQILSESQDQTELGKRLGLVHQGKGIYTNSVGDKFFYNEKSKLFVGWTGKLDPENKEHWDKNFKQSQTVKPVEKVEPKSETVKPKLEDSKIKKTITILHKDADSKIRSKKDVEFFGNFENGGEQFYIIKIDSERFPWQVVHSSGMTIGYARKTKSEVQTHVEEQLNKLSVERFKEIIEKGNETASKWETNQPVSIDELEKVGNKFRHKVSKEEYEYNYSEGGYFSTGKNLKREPTHEDFSKSGRGEQVVSYTNMKGEKVTGNVTYDPLPKKRTPEDVHFSEVKKKQLEMAGEIIERKLKQLEGDEKGAAEDLLKYMISSSETSSRKADIISNIHKYSDKFSKEFIELVKSARYAKDLSKSGFGEIVKGMLNPSSESLTNPPSQKAVKILLTKFEKDGKKETFAVEVPVLNSFKYEGEQYHVTKNYTFDDNGKSKTTTKSGKYRVVHSNGLNIYTFDDIDDLIKYSKEKLGGVRKETLRKAIDDGNVKRSSATEYKK